MLRTTRLSLPIASRLLSSAVSFNFCYNWAPLDPRKHTTMNHNPHNMYLDLYEYGQYPDWYHVCSTAPKTYQTKVVDIIVQTINKRYNTNINAEYLLSKRFREWNRFLGKDIKTDEKFHELYPTLLARLSTGIFVKESRLTWIFEQKLRFDYTLASFDANAPQTIEEFLERYNDEVETLILISNNGFSAEIDQSQSALEKHQTQQHFNFAPGVSELKNLSQQHDNFFNRLLAYIH